MHQHYKDLKNQLKDYGLAPQDWQWKAILPRQNQAYLEHRSDKDLRLRGKWKRPTPQLFQWEFLEWQLQG